VTLLRNYGLGLADTDEDARYQFNKSLPQAWNSLKDIAMAVDKTYLGALSFYLKKAKTDATLPGTLLRRRKTPSAVHFSAENKTKVCRNFTRAVAIAAMTANTCMSPNLPRQETIRIPQNSRRLSLLRQEGAQEGRLPQEEA